MEESLMDLCSQILVGAILILAAVPKIRRRNDFQRILFANYGMVRPALARLVSIIVPTGEITLGSLLIIGIHTELAAWVTFLFLMLVTAAALVSLKDGEECGCSVGPPPSNRGWLVTRNVALIAVTLSIASGSAGEGLSQMMNGSAAFALGLTVLRALGLVMDAHIGRRAPTVNAQTVSRRAFLGRTVAAGASLGFATLLRSARSAEAACYGCRTCPAESIVVICEDGCCTYLVRDRQYCDSGCVACSDWRYERYC